MLLSALVGVLSCEHVDRIDAPPSQSAIHAGMARIATRGTVVRLGSGDSMAQYDESPRMRVSFSYDFWMDRTEVSAASYLEHTARLPREYAGHLPADSIPVTHVTWYDAARYCNARSLAKGLDTVYVYTRADTTSSGTTYRLVNLQCRLWTEGYRLPTEAEWEAAARAGGDTRFSWGTSVNDASTYAWYVQNSSRRPQPSARLRPGRLGLYDMAGNVLEWTNDHKSVYADTLVEDFAGAPEQYSDERSVKGGSYAHGVEYLRPSARSETYPTLGSTAAAYIGFRCVLGPIEAPLYLDLAPQVSDTLPFTVAHTAAWVTPTPRARLAFVRRDGDRRTLCTVDFEQVVPRVTEYRDLSPVFMPVISPDGELVAYCTGGETQVDRSRVYVRPFGDTAAPAIALADSPSFVPRWWTSGTDTFLIYTNSTILNDNPSWRVSSTLRVPMSGGRSAGPVQVLDAGGSFHGGLSMSGRYLATGLPRLYMRDRTTGVTRTLFTAPANGKQVPDTSQVCNVSSGPGPEGEGSVLCIDFGSYGQTSRVTGDIYDVHEYLFRVSFTGAVTGWWRCPPSVSSWDHPEWSYHPDVAVAGVLDRRGRHPAVWGINLNSATQAPLVSTRRGDIWHPYLWVDTRQLPGDDRFSRDSIGMYSEPPPQDQSGAGIGTKMARFWRHCADAQLVFLGSSRVEGGVAPPAFVSWRTYNLSAPGVRLPVLERLIHDYVVPQCPHLRMVAINLHPGWMADTSMGERWPLGMGQTEGFRYDSTHGFWAGRRDDGLVMAISKAPTLVDGAPEDDRGWVRRSSRGYAFHQFAGSGTWDTTDTNFARHWTMMEGLADTLAARGVHLLVIAYPQSPAYRTFTFEDQRYYGRYGPLLSTAEQVWQKLRDLEKRNRYFHFYDAHLFGWHDYGPQDAFDADHLSETGALKLSGRLDSLASVILAN